MNHPILVTGSAGFIGSHLSELFATGDRDGVIALDLAATPDPPATLRADVRCPDQLRQIAGSVRPDTIVHLAAKADVVIPFDELADLIDTNINGTINVLRALRPRRIVFASSCSVYGNARHATGARARWSEVNPLGAYGMTKAAAEIACGDWVRESGGVAVALRFANVIGPRCRGLIAYLAEHALEHPDGRPPARLRGGGRLVRDYVPVDYAARVIGLAVELPLPAGSSVAFNVGSGLPMTNGDVAAIVQRVLRQNGLELTLDFSRPPAPGEAARIVLDMTATTKLLGIPAPTEDDVLRAIEDAALGCVAAIC